MFSRYSLPDYLGTTTNASGQDISEERRAETRQRLRKDIQVLSKLEDLRVGSSRLLADQSKHSPTSVDELLSAMQRQFDLIRQIDEIVPRNGWHRGSFDQCVQRAGALLAHARNLQPPQGPQPAPGTDPRPRMTQSLAEISALLARLPSMAVEIVEDPGHEPEGFFGLPRHMPRSDSVVEAIEFMSVLAQEAKQLNVAPSSVAAQRLAAFKARSASAWLEDPDALIPLRQAIADIHPVLVQEHDRQRPRDELPTHLDIPPFEYGQPCRDIPDLIKQHQSTLREMEQGHA